MSIDYLFENFTLRDLNTLCYILARSLTRFLVTAFSNSKTQFSILVVDDDDRWRLQAHVLCRQLFQENENQLYFCEAASIAEARQFLANNIFHVVLLGKKLPGDSEEIINSISYVKEIKSLQPLTELLIYTVDEDRQYLVQAMQSGASGYMIKEDGEDWEEFRGEQLRHAFLRAEAIIERETLSPIALSEKSEFVARSSSMKRIDLQLEALAEVPKAVLFLGASGVGKTEAAKRLHHLRNACSTSPKRPFLKINVANLTNDLAISELFGNEANAFIGAEGKTKGGYLQLARNGDLFFDKIGEASLDLQAKLLKVIEEKTYQRLGGTINLTTDAKLMFATSRDLKELVRRGKFREDFFMRISTFTIEIPSINDRKADIPGLIQVFLDRFNEDHGGKPVKFEDLPREFIEHLKRDDIPGNMRGLENDINRVLVWAPEDQDGKRHLTNWRGILGLNRRYIPKVHSPEGSFSLEQLLNCPSDVVKPGFPGLSEIKKILELKILSEAEKKYPKLTERAKVLGMPLSNLSRKYPRTNPADGDRS